MTGAPVPFEVAATTIGFYAAWLVAVAGVLVVGRQQTHAVIASASAGLPVGGRPAARAHFPWQDWRRLLLEQRPVAAILAFIYLSASLVLGQLNPIALGVFCQALVGLAIARSIAGFEPLPVVRAIREHKHAVRAVVLLVLLGVVANLAARLLGAVGLGVGALFHEPDLTSQMASSFHVNAFQAFFVLLGGAGVAEEVMFRLVAVSLVWRLTGHAWMGVVVGSLLFAAYHLTPLDGLYRSFWQFPIGAVVSNFLVGTVWGVLYVKRGLESAIGGHTLLDWFTFLFFAH